MNKNNLIAGFTCMVMLTCLLSCSSTSNVNKMPKKTRVETENAVYPALAVAEKMLKEKNQIFDFALFFETPDKSKTVPLPEYGSSAFTKELMDSIAIRIKDTLATGTARMIAVIGEGTLYQQKYHPGIPDAVIIRVFHKETTKLVDYVYPFTRIKKSIDDGYYISIKQGLRFFVD